MAWYALYTRSRHEKKVYDQLLEKDVETFLPLTRELRQWKDRRRWVEVPLFNGYVFINIDLRYKLTALQTHGAVRLVSFGGEPTMIPDWQIEQLMQVLSNTETVEPEDYLKIGDLVTITQGPLRGVQGYLREKRGEWRLSILVDGVYQSASFVVERGIVEKVETTETENV